MLQKLKDFQWDSLYKCKIFDRNKVDEIKPLGAENWDIENWDKTFQNFFFEFLDPQEFERRNRNNGLSFADFSAVYKLFL